jgi:hypothetical protein
MIPNDPQWPISGFQKSQTTFFFFRLHPGVVVDVKLKIGEDLGSSMRIKIFEDMMEMTRLGPSEKWRIDHFTSCANLLSLLTFLRTHNVWFHRMLCALMSSYLDGLGCTSHWI